MNFWIISIPLFLVLVQQSSQLDISSKEHLRVYFKFYCRADSGSYYELYGRLDVQIDGGQKHNVYYVSESNAGKHQVRNRDFEGIFKEMPVPSDVSDNNDVILTGIMMEDDTSGDDLFGKYNGTKIKIGYLKKLSWRCTFKGEDGNYVFISIVYVRG